MRLFNRAAFENGLRYSHCDSKIFNGNKLVTFYFYANVMEIGPVTLEMTTVKMHIFG